MSGLEDSPAVAISEPSDNQKSWDTMVQVYEDWITKSEYTYLRPMLQLVQTIAASEQATRFRAGNSMINLVVSTVSYYGLKPEDAAVTVIAKVIVPDVPNKRITRNNWAALFDVVYRKPGDLKSYTSVSCSEDRLLLTVNAALAQLWRDTKSMPVCSNSAEGTQI